MKIDNAVLCKQGSGAQTFGGRKGTLFAAEFQKMAGSSAWLYFAEVFTLLVIGCVVAINKCFAAMERFFQGPALAITVIVIAELVLGLLLAGVWMVYRDAKTGKPRKLSGVMFLLTMHWGILILLIVGFLVTLPLFTEVMERPEQYDVPLQIIYCGYVILGLYVVVALRVLHSLHGNLSFWGTSAGPVNALLITLIALAVVMFLVFCANGWGTIAVLALLAVICSINLVLQYMETMKRCGVL